jgi:MoxR-like ATPase
MTTVTSKSTPLSAWEKAEFAIANSSRVLLHGLPGTGKTYFGLTKGLQPGVKAYRLICTEEMSDSDLIGGYRQQGNGLWKFREGVGIKAWREGARLVVDEINRMNSDVESRLMALTDTEVSASWQNEETGEVIKPHPNFSVVATMNGEPEDLAPAILDRFVVRCQVDTPHPEAIQALPEYLRSLATSLTDPDATHRYSIRNFVVFEQLFSKTKDLPKSVQSVFPESADQILDALLILTKEKPQVSNGA